MLVDESIIREERLEDSNRELKLKLEVAEMQTKALREQLTREPRPLPTMQIKNRGQDIFHFRYDDFTLLNYDPHPALKMEIAV